MNKLLLFIIFVLVGCTNKSIDNETTLQKKYVGWFYNNCLVIKAPSLKPETTMVLVDAETKKIIVDAKVQRVANTFEECEPLSKDRRSVNTEGQNDFYVISKKAEPENSPNFGIAVTLGSNSPINSISKTLDINNDGKKDSFSYCTSSEGINFDVWSQDPYESKHIWSGYYYLGYDIESNCP